jgi:hypothetical protein
MAIIRESVLAGHPRSLSLYGAEDTRLAYPLPNQDKNSIEEIKNL